MRTHTLHQQKPLFRRRDTDIPRQEAVREVREALQAAIDHIGNGTLLAEQIKQAIYKSKHL
jgi:hypothetical protein